jgi:hypothetical protein
MHVLPLGMHRCVLITRCEPCRDLQHTSSLKLDGYLDLDPFVGSSSTFLIAVRLNTSCLIQINVATTQRIGELLRTITDKLRLACMDTILSWNSSLLASNDDRGLLQVGIVHGSVIECALAMRGGMQGTAESADGRRRTNEQVRQCISKVQSMKSFVDQAISNITQPIVSESAATESSGQVEALSGHAPRGTETKVCAEERLWEHGYLRKEGNGLLS